MYKLFAVDELLNNLEYTHSILNFVKNKVPVYDIKEISSDTNAIIYINEAVNYKDYDNFIRKAAKVKIIIDYSFEDKLDDHLIESSLKHFKTLGISNKDVLFIMNISSTFYVSHSSLNVFYFDFFLADGVRRLSENKFSDRPISNRNPKLNFLVAKLKKVSRFLTIYCLFKRKLLKKQVVLSLLCTDEDLLFHKNAFPEIDDHFYQKIKKYYGPWYNDLSEENRGRNTMGETYLGWPNDVRLYDESNVSIICETSERWAGWHPNFITEKTYRTILNKHPFVIQGPPGMLECLRGKGFKTFNNVIDESYDESKDVNLETIDKVIDSALSLQQKILTNPKEIQSIVDHNYNTMIDIGTKEIDRLSIFIFDYINH